MRIVLVLAAVLGLAGVAHADDAVAGAPRRIEMPRRVLRAVARRPKVTVEIAPAAVTTERPAPSAPRASFVERITRTVSEETF